MIERKNLKQIDKDIVLAKEKLCELKVIRSELIKRRFLVCSDPYRKNFGCGKRTQLGKLTYLQTHYYVRPTGCTEGDYYLPDKEGEYLCPKCGSLNRLIQERGYINNLKEHFSSIEMTF